MKQPDLAIKIFRLLLLCYPRDFRQQYGDDMQLTFEAARGNSHNNALGLFSFWLPTIVDVLISAAREHALVGMEASMFGKVSVRQIGHILMFSGACWVLGAASVFETLYIDKFGGSDGWYEAASYLQWAAFFAALFGLSLLFSLQAGRWSRIGLGIAVAGHVVAIAMWIAISFTPVMVDEVLWNTSWFVVMVAWFGVTAYGMTQLFDEFNLLAALSVAAGIVPLLGLGISLAIEATTYAPDTVQWIQFSTFVLIGVVWIFWGWTVAKPVMTDPTLSMPLAQG